MGLRELCHLCFRLEIVLQAPHNQFEQFVLIVGVGIEELSLLPVAGSEVISDDPILVGNEGAPCVFGEIFGPRRTLQHAGFRGFNSRLNDEVMWRENVLHK